MAQLVELFPDEPLAPRTQRRPMAVDEVKHVAKSLMDARNGKVCSGGKRKRVDVASAEQRLNKKGVLNGDGDGADLLDELPKHIDPIFGPLPPWEARKFLGEIEVAAAKKHLEVKPEGPTGENRRFDISEKQRKVLAAHPADYPVLLAVTERLKACCDGSGSKPKFGNDRIQLLVRNIAQNMWSTPSDDAVHFDDTEAGAYPEVHRETVRKNKRARLGARLITSVNCQNETEIWAPMSRWVLSVRAPFPGCGISMDVWVRGVGPQQRLLHAGASVGQPRRTQLVFDFDIFYPAEWNRCMAGYWLSSLQALQQQGGAAVAAAGLSPPQAKQMGGCLVYYLP